MFGTYLLRGDLRGIPELRYPLKEKIMKKLIVMIWACLALVLAGCEDHHDHDDDHDDHHHHNADTRSVVEISSDRTLDGHITADLGTGALSVPILAPVAGNLRAGIEISSMTGAAISETRAFLVFPLGALPSNSSIQSASVRLFLKKVSFTKSSSDPIPFLLESTDTILFPPPIVSTSFHSPFRANKPFRCLGADTGNFVDIDVTSLLVDAQARMLPYFEVRLSSDQTRFQNDPTTTQGLIEIEAPSMNESRTPLLHVEFS